MRRSGGSMGERCCCSCSTAPWRRRSACSRPLVLFAMMVLTCVDVVGRYFLSRPIFGAFEITEMLLAALIFAGLPLVTLRNEHVTVDVLDPITPDWLFRIQHVVACALGIAVDRLSGVAALAPGSEHGQRRRDHGAAQVQARLSHLRHEHPDGADRAGAAGAGVPASRGAASPGEAVGP